MESLKIAESRVFQQALRPDPQIFSQTTFNAEWIRSRLKELSYLLPRLQFSFSDERREVFIAAGGIADLARELLPPKLAINDEVIEIHRERDGIKLDAVFQYAEGGATDLRWYEKGIRLVPGGTPYKGFFRGLKKAIVAFMQGSPKWRSLLKIRAISLNRGLFGCVFVRHPDPRFEGATREKMINEDVLGMIEDSVYEGVKSYLMNNPESGKRILKLLRANQLEQNKRTTSRKDADY